MQDWSSCSPNWFYLSVLPGLKVKPHSSFPPGQHLLVLPHSFGAQYPGRALWPLHPFCSMISSQPGSKDSTETLQVLWKDMIQPRTQLTTWASPSSQ